MRTCRCFIYASWPLACRPTSVTLAHHPMLALLCAVALPLTAGLANHTAVNRTAHATTHRASNETAATLSAHRQKPLLCGLPLVIRGCGANERDGLAMWQALVIVCAVLCGARVHRVARSEAHAHTGTHMPAHQHPPPRIYTHAGLRRPCSSCSSSSCETVPSRPAGDDTLHSRRRSPAATARRHSRFPSSTLRSRGLCRVRS